MYLVDYLEGRNDRCFEGRRSSVQDIKLKCILLFSSSDTESILDVLGTIKIGFASGILCIYSICKLFFSVLSAGFNTKLLYSKKSSVNSSQKI